MVSGTNKEGEYSNYTYNGLGVRVGTELILNDNTHGYTDFHCQTPSVEANLEGPHGPEVVLSDYVIDYNRLEIDQRVLMEHEVDGYDFRYVYGLDLVNVKVTGEGSDWWGQSIKQCIYSDYVHTDRLGSVVNLSDQFGRVPARVDYDDWGRVTAYESITVTGGFRILLPEITYAGHQYDDILDLFYAKARMYDADNRRFHAIDPVKGDITDPLSLVQYLYVKDNPLTWIDLLGLKPTYQIGDVQFETQSINGKEYAPIRTLLSAYNIVLPKTSSKIKSGGLIYDVYMGRTRAPDGSMYTATLFTGRYELSVWNTTARKHATALYSGSYNPDIIFPLYTMERVDGSYYMSIVCFQKMMKALGYDQQIVPVKPEIKAEDMYVTAEQLEQLGFHGINEYMVNSLNVTLEKYGITKPEYIRQFLAQVMWESGSGEKLHEGDGMRDGNNNPMTQEQIEAWFDRNKSYGAKWRGAGYIQLSLENNYKTFASEIDDPLVVEIGNAYVADNYAWEATGWWWGKADATFKIHEGLDSGRYNTYNISSMVYAWNNEGKEEGKYGHYDERYKMYLKTLEVIK